MFFFDPLHLLIMLPAFLLVMLAEWWVSSTYRKWSQIRNFQGVTGLEAARRLIQYGGLYDVDIEGVPGELTDHYDPRSRTLRLSAGVARVPSVAAVAIAAHEIGHALQHQQGYLPLRFRTAIVPAVNIGSRLGWILILVGLLMRGALGTQLAWLGVIAFSTSAVFALATLPVELNASARAIQLVKKAGLVRSPEEERGVQAVLTAAAFTYVAGLATALIQLLYYVLLVAGMGGRRRS